MLGHVRTKSQEMAASQAISGLKPSAVSRSLAMTAAMKAPEQAVTQWLWGGGRRSGEHVFFWLWTKSERYNVALISPTLG